MSDVVVISGLVASGYCGALAEEQERRQPFRVDLSIGADLSVAGASDQLSDTVDYGEVCSAVERVVTDRRFALMEAMAAAIAETVLERPLVTDVQVTVTKLRPPVPQVLATSGVRITRRAPSTP